MSLDFKIGDFFQPFAILKLRREFSKNQFSADRIAAYQNARLASIVRHASSHVPYYRDQFRRLGLSAADIRCPEDLAQLPVLTKDNLRENYKALQAENAAEFRPVMHHTTGTSGRRLDFLLDRSTNAVEFAFYWRHWNWAGYSLGNRFAEFSSSFFMKPGNISRGRLYHQLGTGRLLMNSLVLSEDNVRTFAQDLARFRPQFLKGLPSVLYYFCLFLTKTRSALPALKAVFSTGEVLHDNQRALIERTLGCKVYNAYGHMERVVAASECERGSLHINPDYGLMELLPSSADSVGTDGGATTRQAKVLGTTLYNFSMPLIRYDLGDIATVPSAAVPCACGRAFPQIARIDGRSDDVVITKQGKVASTLFLVLGQIASIEAGQIIQEAIDRLSVRLVPGPSFVADDEGKLRKLIERHVGSDMRIDFSYTTASELFQSTQGKFRAVVSKISPGRI
jgi:phenylacetate-CoA ligase